MKQTNLQFGQAPQAPDERVFSSFHLFICCVVNMISSFPNRITVYVYWKLNLNRALQSKNIIHVIIIIYTYLHITASVYGKTYSVSENHLANWVWQNQMFILITHPIFSKHKTKDVWIPTIENDRTSLLLIRIKYVCYFSTFIYKKKEFNEYINWDVWRLLWLCKRYLNAYFFGSYCNLKNLHGQRKVE